jgi:hypothetical protein
MRTDTLVVVFPQVTVPTEDLETLRWIVIIDNPLCQTANFLFSTVLGSIVVNVVDSEKTRIFDSATPTPFAVVVKDLVSIALRGFGRIFDVVLDCGLQHFLFTLPLFFDPPDTFFNLLRRVFHLASVRPPLFELQTLL